MLNKREGKSLLENGPLSHLINDIKIAFYSLGVDNPLFHAVKLVENDEVEVKNLASTQINVGYSLPNTEKSLKPGTYSFDVNANNMAYEFQFTVNEEDTNIDVQNKLARLFNHANIGLNAYVTEDTADSSSLRIESTQTGDGNPPGTPLFSIYNTSDKASVDVVDFLGIDYGTKRKQRLKHRRPLVYNRHRGYFRFDGGMLRSHSAYSIGRV